MEVINMEHNVECLGPDNKNFGDWVLIDWKLMKWRKTCVYVRMQLV